MDAKSGLFALVMTHIQYIMLIVSFIMFLLLLSHSLIVLWQSPYEVLVAFL